MQGEEIERQVSRRSPTLLGFKQTELLTCQHSRDQDAAQR